MNEETLVLVSGRRLALSAIWNFIGLSTPMLVALIAIPLLIEGMGKERFGLLAIIWMGVGYFSLFDLGLCRALTKLVADRLGKNQLEDLPFLIWTALILLFVMGVTGAVVVLVTASALVQFVLNMDPQFHDEAITAFHILGLGLPVVIVSAALVGLLEAHQRYATITAVRIPLGILTFIGPLVTLQFTPSLVWATGALVISRTAALGIFFIVTSFVRPELRTPLWPRRTHARSLLAFGGWLSITNIVGPLMTYLDRFFIGAILSVTAVTYYVTPYEVLSRLQILPRSIMGVLFPAMSIAFAGNRSRLVELYWQSSRVILFLMLPVSAGLFLLAPEALDIWLGGEFRIAATPVVQWLAVGWMINTLARPAFTVLQSTGHPDLVAKAHLTELVPYLGILWFFTHAFGIAGTAAAWTLRVLVDTVILNELARWKLPELKSSILRTYIALLAILISFAIAWLLDSLPLRILLMVIVTAGSGVSLWPLFKRFVGPDKPIAAQATVAKSVSKIGIENL